MKKNNHQKYKRSFTRKVKRPKKEEARERKRTIVGPGGLRAQMHWFRAASIRFNIQEKYIEHLINGCIGVHVLKNID